MSAKHIYAIHDWSPDWGKLVRQTGKTAWCVYTFELGDDPNDQSGGDLGNPGEFGVTPIGRINFSHHGNGTIPLPDRYDAFAQRCANFVKATSACKHWIVGNEPNLQGERPGNREPIMPAMYAECFAKVYSRIKRVQPESIVMPAAVAPYNVDTGSWIRYWLEMLKAIQERTGCDAIAVHAYSRGSSPESITSEAKMDPPYQAYYNGFLAYRDFLTNVPLGMVHKPVFITETDQIDPWENRNSGWVRKAYQEIDAWNQRSEQKIHCLALYRWYQHDQWSIYGKIGVVEDFRQTLEQTDYRVPAQVGAGPTPAGPAPTGPTATVTAPSGANIRSGPGTNYGILGAVVTGTVLPVVGKNSQGTWWQVRTETWGTGWVSGTILSLQNAAVVPVATSPAPPPSVLPGVSRDWMIVSWSRILGLDELVVRAILTIESGGRAFENGRMIIRFENHVFQDAVRRIAAPLLPTVQERFRYGSPSWTGHFWRLSPNEEWRPQHTSGQAGEWEVFSFARTLHEEAAMYAISMGMGQIMGGNHNTVGYSSVKSMFNDYSHPSLGEYNQLTGFFAYVVNRTGMREAARRKEWFDIARLYNGEGNEQHYGPLIEAKYHELGGR